MNTKSWEPYGELVNKLEAKGIIISDRMAVIRFLNDVNYYRFLGYLIPLGIRHSSGSTVPFETARMVYEFDTRLRGLISMAIDTIEIYLRSQFGHYYGKHYGSEGYMLPENFNGHHNSELFIRKINLIIKNNHHDPVIIHHLQVYEGHFPIWVIIEFFSIGMLSYFYWDMKNRDKTILSISLYNVSYQILESWMRCITVLRNKCAHYSRLYGWVFTSIPRLPDSIGFTPDRTLFSQLLMLKLMYPDHKKWNNDFLRSLIHLVNRYHSFISLDHIGFPYKWKAILTYK